MPIVTSFNGDWIGYLLPQDRYALMRLREPKRELLWPLVRGVL